MSSLNSTSSPSPSPLSFSSLSVGSSSSITWSHRPTPSTSRYKTDYKILSPLGSGSSGTTYEVLSLVDGGHYALKVVRIRRERDVREVQRQLREVEVLAKLNHDNIVRYYSAWVEKGDEEDFSRCTGVGEDTTSSSFSSSSSPPSGSTTCICNLCSGQYDDWSVSFEHWGLLDSVLQPLNLCVTCYKGSLPPDAPLGNLEIGEKKTWGSYLFILMERCGGNLSPPPPSPFPPGPSSSPPAQLTQFLPLFTQALTGLAHLHENGIIHRDVKPSNIFTRDGVAKIGDLGLAVLSDTQGDVDVGEGKMVEEDTGGDGTHSRALPVGTFLYSAPEAELKGVQVTTAADVYSLGIVLCELYFASFTTLSERASVLSGIKGGSGIPPEWIRKNPPLAKLAGKMTRMVPGERPSAAEVIAEMVVEGIVEGKPSYGQLEELVRMQHGEIGRLRRILKDRDGDGEDGEVL